MKFVATSEITPAIRKWKAYSAYKNSRAKWLGVIPQHWEVKRIKFLASFYGGGTPSKDNLDYWKGDIPWVSPKDMKAEVVNDSEEHITKEALAGSATQLVQAGAVLVVVRSGILKHSIPVAVNVRAVTLNQDMKAMVPRSVLSAHYLKYLIVGHQDALLMEWRKAGATVESIEHELLVNSYFPIPSLGEQLSIINLLDPETAKIDALVSKKERLIELLLEKRATLISRAVTKGLDQNAPMKDSGVEWLGKIPTHWKIRKVKEVSKLQTGITLGKRYDGERLTLRPYLRVANVQDGYLDLEEITEIEVLASDVWRHELQHGDVLMTEGGDFDKLGRGYVWEGQIPGCLHQNHIFAVRPTKGLLDSHFLTLVMNSHYGRGYFTATSKQSTNLASTNSTKLRNFPIPFPDPSEQEEIVNWVRLQVGRIDSLIAKIREGIEKLKEHRTALISAAVTGKIDVRGGV